MKKILNLLVIGTLAVLGANSQAVELRNHDSDASGLAGKIFYVEATILSSPIFPEYEGAILQSCFTFQEDGSWIDLEWPGEGAEPIPGVWFEHDNFPFVNFTAIARWPAAGWTLVENGIATWGHPRRGAARISTYAMVVAEDNSLIFYLRARGHEVETCPLP